MSRLLPTLVLAAGCASRGVVSVTEDELARHLEEEVRAGRAPGVAVAWAHRDGGRGARAAGLARLEPAEPATPATTWPWFSTTKLFTATAVLCLVADGRVDLDAPITRYVAGFPPAFDPPPTVRHLLSHTAGLANPIPVTWIHPADAPGPALDALTARLLAGHATPRWAPGTRHAYSNLGYLALGQLVERVSGERFEDYLARRVLGPLGARSAGFTLGPGSATGYSRRWSAMGVAGRFMLDARWFGATRGGFTAFRPFLVDGAPYGGLVGDVRDLLRLGEAMLARGDGSVLPRALADAALAPARAPDGSAFPVGLGWRLGDAGGEPYAHHLGGGAGFKAELRIYPRLGYAVAVIANETSYDTDGLARSVVGP